MLPLEALIVSWLRPTDRQTDRQYHLLSCPGQLKMFVCGAGKKEQRWKRRKIYGEELFVEEKKSGEGKEERRRNIHFWEEEEKEENIL